jgi:hypothetical protein
MFIGNQKCRAAPLGAEPCEVGGVSLAAELYAFSAARLRMSSAAPRPTVKALFSQLPQPDVTQEPHLGWCAAICLLKLEDGGRIEFLRPARC